MVCEKCGFEYEGASCPACSYKQQTVAHKHEEKSKLGLIGMILAVASFVLKFFGIPAPELPLAITGLILSIIGKKKNRSDGCATAGIIVSVVKIGLEIMSTITGLIMGALLVVFYIVIYGGALGIAITQNGGLF